MQTKNRFGLEGSFLLGVQFAFNFALLPGLQRPLNNYNTSICYPQLPLLVPTKFKIPV